MAGFPNLGGSKDQTVFRSIIISLGFVVAAFAVGMACSPQKKSNNNRSSNSTPVQACETFSDSAACSNSGNCQWTGSLCSGDMEYCGKFVAQNNCPISCQWNMSTSKCQPLPMQSQNISCGTYTNQQACLQVYYVSRYCRSDHWHAISNNWQPISTNDRRPSNDDYW
jgi:hypothetical protein